MGFLKRTHACGALRAEHAGQQVALNGWAHKVRDLGGLFFEDLRDRTGIVQVLIDPSAFPNLNDVRNETCLSLTGEVQMRSEGTRNSRMPTGDVEVVCSGYTILGPAKPIPFRFEESIVNLETALRLAPLRPLNIVNNLAWSFAGNKQYDKAILLSNETLERNPDYLFAYQGLAAAYELSRRHEKALWAAENVMRVNPKFSVAVEEKMSAVQDHVYRKRVLDALRRAGLK